MLSVEFNSESEPNGILFKIKFFMVPNSNSKRSNIIKYNYNTTSDNRTDIQGVQRCHENYFTIHDKLLIENLDDLQFVDYSTDIKDCIIKSCRMYSNIKALIHYKDKCFFMTNCHWNEYCPINLSIKHDQASVALLKENKESSSWIGPINYLVINNHRNIYTVFELTTTNKEKCQYDCVNNNILKINKNDSNTDNNNGIMSESICHFIIIDNNRCSMYTTNDQYANISSASFDLLYGTSNDSSIYFHQPSVNSRHPLVFNSSLNYKWRNIMINKNQRKILKNLTTVGFVDDQIECYKQCIIQNITSCKALIYFRMVCFSLSAITSNIKELYDSNNSFKTVTTDFFYNNTSNELSIFLLTDDEPINSSSLMKNNEQIYSDSRYCSPYEKYSNVSLELGLSSGLFSIIGLTRNIQTCLNISCYLSMNFDIIYQIDDLCFGIKCYNLQNTCKLRNHLPKSSLTDPLHINTDVAFISMNKTIYKKPIIDDEMNNLFCDITSYKSVHLIGSDLVLLMEKTNIYECINLCCQNTNCSAVYLDVHKCYHIDCSMVGSCITTDNSIDSSLSAVVEINKEKKSLYFSSIKYCSSFDKNHLYKNKSFDLTLKNVHVISVLSTLNECIEKCCSTESCRAVCIVTTICYGYFGDSNVDMIPSIYAVYIIPENNSQHSNFVHEIHNLIFLVTGSSMIIISSLIGVCLFYRFYSSKKKMKYIRSSK